MWTNTNSKPIAYLLAISALFMVQCGTGTDQDTETTIGTPPSVSQSEDSVKEVVRLSEEDRNNLNIQTVTVDDKPFIFSLSAPATVFPAPDNISIISAPISGRVSEIFAHEGEHVKQGDPLLRLQSLDYADLVASYLESAAEEKYLQQQSQRIGGLVEKNISSQSSLDRILADLTRAESKLMAAKARLRAVGVSEQQIEHWNTGSEDPDSDLIIRTPITGTINEHLVDLGTSVAPNQVMMDVINNSTVLIRGYVAPNDAAFLKPGMPVIFSQRGESSMNLSGRSISADITTINPALDEMNRSIIVNSIVKTTNGWPVIGQNIRASYEMEIAQQGFSIPVSAVQYEGDNAVVFIQIDAYTYEKRPVQVSTFTEEAALINSGLNIGDKVAVTQVFSLKALGKFEEFAD